MLQRVVHPSGLVAYRSPALSRLGVVHAFSTRIGPGGVELDLREPTAETLVALRECAGTHEALPLCTMKQVHGAVVHELGSHVPTGIEGDAWVSSRSDRLALVYTADCVPVLVASADGKRVSAIHAGWRGLVAEVIPAALHALGTAPAIAAIGPCLSRSSCEMGPEVAEQFRAVGLEACIHERPGARPYVDLREAARLQLERAGCTTIDISDRCTYEHADELPSHRREVTHGGRPRSGRIGALIAARG